MADEPKPASDESGKWLSWCRNHPKTEHTPATWVALAAFLEAQQQRIAELEAACVRKNEDGAAAYEWGYAEKARVRELEAALRECADDLAAELRHRYAYIDDKPHPAEAHRYARDMEPVDNARKLLGEERAGG